jgi:hypothetical protein
MLLSISFKAGKSYFPGWELGVSRLQNPAKVKH